MATETFLPKSGARAVSISFKLCLRKLWHDDRCRLPARVVKRVCFGLLFRVRSGIARPLLISLGGRVTDSKPQPGPGLTVTMTRTKYDLTPM